MRKKLLAVLSLAFATALSTGIAVSASAVGEPTKLDGFEITGYSVRTENFKDAQGVEVENSTGLRFKTVTPDAQTAYEDAYTIITVAGAAEDADQAKVSAQVWRTADNGWNTVLLGIPEAAYGTEITAQSYVVLNGQVHETDPVAISIDVAASQALNLGNTADKLYDYTEDAVKNITFEQTSVNVELGATLPLAATVVPEKYSVVWASSDPEVATVDNTGKVKAVGEVGQTATITATMSGVSASCEVTLVYPDVIDFENGYNPIAVDPTCDNSAGINTGWMGLAKVDKENGVLGNGNLSLRIRQARSQNFFTLPKGYVDQVFADPDVKYLEINLYREGTEVFAADDNAKPKSLCWYYEGSGGSGNQMTTYIDYVLDEEDPTHIVIRFGRGGYDAWYAASKSEVASTYFSFMIAFRANPEATGNKALANTNSLYYLDDIGGKKDVEIAKTNTTVYYSYPTVVDYEDAATYLAIYDAGNNGSSGTSGEVSIVDDGTGNHMLKASNAGSTNFTHFLMSKAYLTYVFETLGANALTMDMYTDQPYLRYVMLRQGNNKTIIGMNGDGMPTKGIPTTIENETYYRYTLTLDISAYTYLSAYDFARITVDSSASITIADGAATVVSGTVSTMYFDNLTAVTANSFSDTIDFADGSITGAFYIGREYGVNGVSLNVVKHGEDYALEYITPKDTDTKLMLSLNTAYLNYVFNLQSADALTFKVYIDPTIANEAAFKLGVSGTQLKGGLTSVYDAEKGCFTVTMSKEFYFECFDAQGAYISGSIGGAESSNKFMLAISTSLNGDIVKPNGVSIYLDDFTVVKAQAE